MIFAGRAGFTSGFLGTGPFLTAAAFTLPLGAFLISSSESDEESSSLSTTGGGCGTYLEAAAGYA